MVQFGRAPRTGTKSSVINAISPQAPRLTTAIVFDDKVYVVTVVDLVKKELIKRNTQGLVSGAVEKVRQKRGLHCYTRP